jgi:hypothetical protein
MNSKRGNQIRCAHVSVTCVQRKVESADLRKEMEEGTESHTVMDVPQESFAYEHNVVILIVYFFIYDSGYLSPDVYDGAGVLTGLAVSCRCDI